MTLKAGTQIRTKGSPSVGGMPAVTPETAHIRRWNQRISGERMNGWHVIRFDTDGAECLMHESNFEVIV